MEREGGERSEKVSGEGFGKFVGGKKYRDRFLSIFNFQFRSGPGPLCSSPEVVLAHFAFVALLAHLRQIGNFPIRFREFPYSVTGVSLFDFGIFPIRPFAKHGSSTASKHHSSRTTVFCSRNQLQLARRTKSRHDSLPLQVALLVPGQNKALAGNPFFVLDPLVQVLNCCRALHYDVRAFAAGQSHGHENLPLLI